jgi:hypothetical protein
LRRSSRKLATIGFGASPRTKPCGREKLNGNLPRACFFVDAFRRLPGVEFCEAFGVAVADGLASADSPDETSLSAPHPTLKTAKHAAAPKGVACRTTRRNGFTSETYPSRCDLTLFRVERSGGRLLL